jgi:hypothetical protein
LGNIGNVGIGNQPCEYPPIAYLNIFDDISSLISFELARFDQKFPDRGAEPIGGYFPKNMFIYLILD